ncbi:hypothetical protein AgCh_007420 [Apium graveolens]
MVATSAIMVARFANKVINLDVGLFVAGRKYPGEFEERLKELMFRITSAPGSVVGWPRIRSFRKNIASGYAPKLLAAQNDPSINNIQNIQAEKAITGLLDGSGEYTLVYEDNEGDIMLVGDVPW